MSDLLDLPDAAHLLGVSVRTLYRERKSGRLTFTKIRGSTKVERSELERYVRDAKQRAAA